MGQGLIFRQSVLTRGRKGTHILVIKQLLCLFRWKIDNVAILKGVVCLWLQIIPIQIFKVVCNSVSSPREILTIFCVKITQEKTCWNSHLLQLSNKFSVTTPINRMKRRFNIAKVWFVHFYSIYHLENLNLPILSHLIPCQCNNLMPRLLKCLQNPGWTNRRSAL